MQFAITTCEVLHWLLCRVRRARCMTGKDRPRRHVIVLLWASALIQMEVFITPKRDVMDFTINSTQLNRTILKCTQELISGYQLNLPHLEENIKITREIKRINDRRGEIEGDGCNQGISPAR